MADKDWVGLGIPKDLGLKGKKPVPVYTLNDLPKMRDKYWIGTSVDIMDIKEDGGEKLLGRRRRMTIGGVYQSFVRLVDEYGHNECFGYVEMEQIMVNASL